MRFGSFRFALRGSVLGLVVSAGLSLGARSAWADVTHVVQRGHTLEAIAHRYHVSEKAIIEANHLKDPTHLKPGQELVIPGVEGKKKKGDKPVKGGEKSEERGPKPGRAAIAAVEPAPMPRTVGPKGAAETRVLARGEDGTVQALRTGEAFRVRVKDDHGHIPPSALKAFERMMRQGNATHPVDPRLVALVGIVSNHFGGRPLEIVSGYRAYSPSQYSPHSNHNLGKALDFRVRGVNNVELCDFCRTLRSAGCGFYPNSTFVHLDVRETKAYWVDYARPGEPPKYDKGGATADEGMGEVPVEGTGGTPDGSTETPDAAPAESKEKVQ
jgi:uncharacterized protein YcbK (DUF882 family)